MENKSCEYCQKEFIKGTSIEYNWKRKRYCTKKCQQIGSHKRKYNYVKKGWNPKSGVSTRFKKGNKHPFWKSGNQVTYRNYARQIISEHLGRELIKGEAVHHLDHNYQNNEIDNLYVFPNNVEHLKYHRFKVRLVKSFLNQMEG